MTKKYFIQQFLGQDFVHGGIGCVDAERVLLQKGFRPILFPYQHSFSFKAKLSRSFFLLKTFFNIGKGSIVVFLFPTYARMTGVLLGWLRRKKGVKLVCYIADINGIKDGDEKLLEKEIQFFRRFQHFIVHNDKMKTWVEKNVSPKAHTQSIEFFDFLAQPVIRQRELSFNIVFAGNLEKSAFLKELHLLESTHPSLHFHLYGPGYASGLMTPKNITYHGTVKPYELPAQLNGSFGLLWDGDKISTPHGSLGHYMQFISHHKLSLYILSKLPIIVPAIAASAPLIAKYKIGFAVHDLTEIEEKIKNLSAADYWQMQMNMRELAEKISQGECLGNVLDRLL